MIKAGHVSHAVNAPEPIQHHHENSFDVPFASSIVLRVESVAVVHLVASSVCAAAAALNLYCRQR